MDGSILDALTDRAAKMNKMSSKQYYRSVIWPSMEMHGLLSSIHKWELDISFAELKYI